jgi:hypothetical protein
MRAMRCVLCWVLKHPNPTLAEIMEEFETAIEEMENDGTISRVDNE